MTGVDFVWARTQTWLGASAMAMEMAMAMVMAQKAVLSRQTLAAPLSQ
jgi:hypothetical protein